MNNLTEIAIFVKVVESGSFTAAAEKLGMSRAAASKSVSRLEDRLGARLLQRTTRTLSMTEAGEVLFHRSRRGLSEIEAAELEVDHLQGEPRGILRISGPVYFGVRHLTPVLAEFLTAHPAVEADVQLDDRLVHVVEEGFDLVVRVTVLEDSSLVSRRLAPCRTVVCASPDYWARHSVPERPADLIAHNCFIYSNLPSPDIWRFLDSKGRDVTVQVRGNLRFNNTEMAVAAVRQGLGVIRVPTFYIGDELSDGRLVAALTEYASPREASVYAVYPARDHLPPKVRSFIDLLAERFGPEPYWDRF
ncbi:MAG: LysR family transcriptional regulator [Gammaproteobacteria bacterium]